MAGDDLQAMKRGISEFAELILLNKAEEPMSQAARKALLELKMSQTLRSHPAQVRIKRALLVSYFCFIGTASVSLEGFWDEGNMGRD